MNRQTSVDILILRYLGGEATDSERTELRERVEADPKLAARIYAGACQEIELDEFFRSRLAEVRSVPLRSTGFRRLLPVAASIALLAAGFVALLQVQKKNSSIAILSSVDNGVAVVRDGEKVPGTENMELFIGDKVMVSKAGTTQIQYPGEETTLSLQPGAAIKFLSDRQGKRIRLVRGSIDADVARQPEGNPMHILSDTGDVEILGTRLVFSADNGSSRVDTISGSVSLTSGATGDKQVVESGNYALLDAQGALRSGKTVPRITGFTLVYADTHEPIPDFGLIEENVEVDMTDLYISRPSRIACRVDTEPAVLGSVMLVRGAGETVRILDEPPYIVPLGQDKDYYLPGSEKEATGWTVFLTPFSKPEAQGVKGTTRRFHIKVMIPSVEDMLPGELKVVNGGFESPAILDPAWEYSTPVAWGVTKIPIIRKNKRPPEGSQHLSRHHPITLGQDLLGAVEAGTTYELKYSAMLNEAESSLTTRVLVGGETVATMDISHTDAPDRWNEFSLAFTAGPDHENAPVRLEFQVKQAELDNVTVASQSISL